MQNIYFNLTSLFLYLSFNGNAFLSVRSWNFFQFRSVYYYRMIIVHKIMNILCYWKSQLWICYGVLGFMGSRRISGRWKMVNKKPYFLDWSFYRTGKKHGSPFSSSVYRTHPQSSRYNIYSVYRENYNFYSVSLKIFTLFQSRLYQQQTRLS